MTPKIIIYCGLPGCGKSTFSKTETPDAVVLCPDLFRMEITGRQYFQPAEDLVWAVLKTTARVLARTRPVIIDGTHVSVSNRYQWLAIGSQIGVPVECYWFDISFEQCCKQNRLRQMIVPDEVIQNMLNRFQIPSYEEGFESIFRIQRESSDYSIELLPKPSIECRDVESTELG